MKKKVCVVAGIVLFGALIVGMTMRMEQGKMKSKEANRVATVETKTSQPAQETSQATEEPEITGGLQKVDVKGKKIKDKKYMHQNDIQTACLEKAPEMEEYLKETEEIYKGEVVGMEYYDENGNPWTKLQVKILNNIKGAKKVGRLIDVYVMEGYTYDQSDSGELIEVVGDDVGIHKIGDVSYFAVNCENGESIFEKGTYRRSFGCYSEYRLMSGDEGYNIYDTKEAGVYSEKQLEKKIEKYI